MTAEDIALFDFRDKIYVKETLYFVIKISDYNKLKPGLAKVELLKIKEASSYEPESGISIGVIETNSTNVGLTARYAGSDPTETNFGSADNVLLGDNNLSRSVGSYISGSRNTVAENSLRVSIISSEGNNIGDNCDGINLSGCRNCNIGSRCTNITLVNCENITVLEDITNFTGTNLSGNTISGGVGGAPNHNNTARVGVLTTFESSGTSI